MKRKVIVIVATLLSVLCLISLGIIALSNATEAHSEITLMIPNIPTYGIVIYAIVITTYIVVVKIRSRKKDEEGKQVGKSIGMMIILTLVLAVLIVSTKGP